MDKRRPHSARSSFTAIDFETANVYRDSACAIGLARVEGGRVVRRGYHLIRPPSRWFVFTDLHGIDWRAVCREPSLPELWPVIAHYFEGIDFLVAHNAPFDASVLEATCAFHGMRIPRVPFECTLRMARSRWGLKPATLRHVADFLGVPLKHHHAGSDAEACARIALHALRA